MSNKEDFELYAAEYLGRLHNRFPIKENFSTYPAEFNDSRWLEYRNPYQSGEAEADPELDAEIGRKLPSIRAKLQKIASEAELRTETLEYLHVTGYFDGDVERKVVKKGPVLDISHPRTHLHLEQFLEQDGVKIHVIEIRNARLTPKSLETTNAILPDDNNHTTMGERAFQLWQNAANGAHDAKAISEVVGMIFGFARHPQLWLAARAMFGG